MNLKREDLSFNYNADGYMLMYKGEFIGGASVLPRSKPLHWRHREANLRDFKESAQRRIDELLSGRIDPHSAFAIEAIDKAMDKAPADVMPAPVKP